ncbi:MAG: hypothetical protein GY719_22370 [bacterium]|nr:hypothetical protein [bacterium]
MARRSDSRRRRMVCLGLAAMLAGGCLGTGSRMLPQDRRDYASAIADARKQQALLNIVRIRYSEFPSFLDLTQVVTSYSLLHQLAIKGLIKTPFLHPNDDFSGVYTAQFAEKPSLTYLPVGGADFVRKLLTPIDMSVILSLIQTGWPADRLLEGLVVSANGWTNRELQGHDVNRADPQFVRFVDAMQEAQLANALSAHMKPLSAEDTAAILQASAVAQAAAAAPSATVRGAAMAALPPPPPIRVELCFWPEALSDAGRERLAAMRSELGLDPQVDCYDVVPGDIPPDDKSVAVQTRSLMHFLVELAACVEVPAEDLASGAAPRLAVTEVIGGSGDRPLIRIRSGPSPPDDPLVAVKYAGSWFWIDNDDDHSKRTFAYLAMLLSITESGGGGAQLVVTTN